MASSGGGTKDRGNGREFEIAMFCMETIRVVCFFTVVLRALTHSVLGHTRSLPRGIEVRKNYPA